PYRGHSGRRNGCIHSAGCVGYTGRLNFAANEIETMKILVVGGAGFVGAALARTLRVKYPSSKVVAADNLKRRGSELNLRPLREDDIEFVHLDIRNPADFDALDSNFDTISDASAEPSVLA